MRRMTCAASLMVVVGIAATSLGEVPQARLMSVDEAVAIAIAKNLDLKSAEAEVGIARARRSGARLLLPTNPEIEVEAGPRRRPGEPTSTDVEITVEQAIPIGGQRSARVRAADASIRAAESRRDLRLVQIVADVRIAFAQAVAAEQRLKLATEAEELARDALRAAEERLRAGATSTIEVNTAQVERGRALRDLVAARYQLLAPLSNLKVLLALPPSTALALKEPSQLPPGRPDTDKDAVVSAAAERHPAIRAAIAELQAARGEQSVATREMIPDVRLGIVAAREEGADIIKGRIGISPPLFNRRQGDRATTSARIVQAERALESAQRGLAQSISLALSRREAAHAGVQAYAGNVLKALFENLALVNEAYRAGKVDFLQLLLIRRQTLEARRAYIDAREESMTADASLKQALGEIQ